MLTPPSHCMRWHDCLPVSLFLFSMPDVFACTCLLSITASICTKRCSWLYINLKSCVSLVCFLFYKSTCKQYQRDPYLMYSTFCVQKEMQNVDRDLMYSTFCVQKEMQNVDTPFFYLAHEFHKLYQERLQVFSSIV